MDRTSDPIVKLYQIRMISTELSAMPSTLSQRTRRLGLLSLAILAANMTGCSSLNVPTFSAFSQKAPGPSYAGLDPAFESQASSSEDVYYKVRQARAQNSIVLEVIGDDMPARVLPLPPGQRSVLVSDLLKQTGVQKKLGAVEAILFRHDPNTIGGVRMAIKMSQDKKSVRAETDYALRPGDRLRVKKAPPLKLQELLGMTLGLG